MSEKSWPWSTVAGLGDGAAELGEGDSRLFLASYFGVQDLTAEGVSKGVLNELEVTGAATPLQVDTGSGICYGLYYNDAALNLTITTPTLGTTGGRVVLQTNWAGTGGASLEARTRAAVIYSPDGNPAIPALTQAFGTTWEISLAYFTITTGGVITLTDDRTFRRATVMIDENELLSTIAGDGLSGGEGSALEVNVDGTTIEINLDDLRIAASAAGNGLSGGGGSALYINVDNTTIEINADILRVKDSGITPVKSSFFNVFNSDSAIYAGWVDDDGTSTLKPSGWSTSRVSLGHYRVTHSLNDSNMVIVCTINGLSNDNTVTMNPASNNYFDVETRQSGSLTDLGFHFIAIRF